MIPARRILIIRPSALGDVARSVPVLASLRAAYPDAQIDWLVRDAFAPVIAHHPALSNVIPFPRNDFSRWFTRLQWHKIRAFGRSLRAREYDIVLDCQGLARSGWMAWASGARVRVGSRGARELAWLGYSHRVRSPKVIHTVEAMLALLGPLGVPALAGARASTLYCNPSDQRWERNEPYASREYVVLAPTSAWPAKEWPAERFAALAERLLHRHGARGRSLAVVLVGAGHERVRLGPLLALAQRNPSVVDRVGGTSIGQLMAILERASLVVANDSASLHIACGLHRPVVALLGPTDPKLACPYGREEDVLQHVRDGDEFYFRDDRSAGMIGRITLDEAFAACEARLR